MMLRTKAAMLLLIISVFTHPGAYSHQQKTTIISCELNVLDGQGDPSSLSKYEFGINSEEDFPRFSFKLVAENESPLVIYNITNPTTDEIAVQLVFETRSRLITIESRRGNFDLERVSPSPPANATPTPTPEKYRYYLDKIELDPNTEVSVEYPLCSEAQSNTTIIGAIYFRDYDGYEYRIAQERYLNVSPIRESTATSSENIFRTEQETDSTVQYTIQNESTQTHSAGINTSSNSLTPSGTVPDGKHGVPQILTIVPIFMIIFSILSAFSNNSSNRQDLMFMGAAASAALTITETFWPLFGFIHNPILLTLYYFIPMLSFIVAMGLQNDSQVDSDGSN